MSEKAKSMSEKLTINNNFLETVILDLDFFNLKNYQLYHKTLDNWLSKSIKNPSSTDNARGIVFKTKLHYFGNSVNDEQYEHLENATKILLEANDWLFLIPGEVILIRRLMVQGKFDIAREKIAYWEQAILNQKTSPEIENEIYYIKSVFHDVVGEYELGAMIVHQRLEVCKKSDNTIIHRQLNFFKLCLSSIFFKLGFYKEALLISIQVFKFANGNTNSRLFLFTIDTIPLCFLFLHRYQSCKNFILKTNGLIEKIETRRTKRFRQSLLNRCYIKLEEVDQCTKIPKLVKGEVLNKYDQLEFDIDNISFDFRKNPKKKYLIAMLRFEKDIEQFPANSKLTYYKGLAEMAGKLRQYKLAYEINEKLSLIEEKINTDKAKNMTIGFKIKNDMEALKQEMKAAEEKSRIKHEFLLSISHDLRSPLASVISATSLMGNKNLTESIRNSYVQTAKNSANGLINMIDEMLEVSSIESRAIQVNMNEIFVEDFIDFIIESHRLQAEEKKLSLNANLTELKLKIIKSDAHLLQRILSNLITNAIKYSHQGEIELSISNEMDYIYFKVKDNGIGIQEDNLDSIFDLYSKTGKESAKRKDSHGLGLYIVKNLVGALKGSIAVSSSIGCGSIFTVKLPLSQPLR
jgi:signal transduction histidine kinase